MGLMPQYRLLANAADITATIADRLVSLRYTDSVGLDSDELEIVLADHTPEYPIMLPPTGAELSLSLGYDGRLRYIGLFVCDELELSGWPGQMTIRARAAPQDKTPAGKTSLRGQQSKAWPKGMTLGKIVADIAAAHGMQPAVAKSLASIVQPHLSQTDESDLSFLVRLARQYGAAVKPGNGKLILARKGESKATSGVEMPTITLTPYDDITSWSVSIASRETAGQVVAYWHAVDQAKRHEVSVGSGEPVRRLKMQYPTEAMALAAARADLERRDRQKKTLSITMVGRPDIGAECPLILEGFRDGVSGEWLITRTEHTLGDSGYVTTIEAEVPTSDDLEKTSDNEN